MPDYDAMYAEIEGLRRKISSLGRVSAGHQSRADKAKAALAIAKEALTRIADWRYVPGDGYTSPNPEPTYARDALARIAQLEDA